MANMKITRNLLICTGLDGFADLRVFCSVKLLHTPEGRTIVELAKGHSSLQLLDVAGMDGMPLGQEEFLEHTAQGKALYLEAMNDLTKSVEEKAKQNLFEEALNHFQLVEAVNA